MFNTMSVSVWRLWPLCGATIKLNYCWRWNENTQHIRKKQFWMSLEGEMLPSLMLRCALSTLNPSRLLGLPPPLRHASAWSWANSWPRRSSRSWKTPQRFTPTTPPPTDSSTSSRRTLSESRRPPSNEPVIIIHLLSSGSVFTPTLSSKGPVNVCVLIMSVVTVCNKLHVLLVWRNEGKSFLVDLKHRRTTSTFSRREYVKYSFWKSIKSCLLQIKQ